MICLTGDKDYWYEGSPINDLTIRNCRFVGKRGRVVASPSFDVCAGAPYYHSGIKILNNTFDATMALDCSNCSDIVFEGNVNSAGLPFENQFHACVDVVEKM